MKTLILLDAEDQFVGSSFAVRGTPEDLKRVVRETIEAHIEDLGEPWADGSHGFLEECRDAFCEMIDRHSDWSQGRHELQPIEPLWGGILLIVVETEHGYLY